MSKQGREGGREREGGIRERVRMGVSKDGSEGGHEGVREGDGGVVCGGGSRLKALKYFLS